MLRACGLVLGLLAVCCGRSFADENEVDRWAVLVGIDDYADLVDLNCAAADQRAFADQLVACGYPRDHVFLLESKAEQAKYLPSKLNIEKQLDIVLRLAARGDVVVLSFSGHGVQIDGASYLCPLEARWDEPATMISLDDIYKRLQNCRADLKLALIDACREQNPRLAATRSTSATRGVSGLGKASERPPRGVMMLTSCDFGQLAYEEKELGYGIFMHFVLEGLKGQADRDGNRQVSLQELARFAAERTKTYVARKFNDIQEPALRGEVALEVLDYPLALLSAANSPRPMSPAQFKPGEVVKNVLGMKFVAIPVGEFQMGSAESAAELAAAGFQFLDTADFNDERPVHQVRLTEPFYLGMYEVTKAQFAEFVEATGYTTEAEKDGKGGYGWSESDEEFSDQPHYTWRSWGVDQSPQSPVVNVSWNDAVAYCDWVTLQDGNKHRLPTEAEWEYACRARTDTRFHHGDEPEGLAKVGNVADGSAKAKFTWWTRTLSSLDGYAFTCPVGRFRPNAFGLYDMHGNVVEWCADYYGEYSTDDAVDPTGPLDGKLRVCRGGGWFSDPVFCRSAYRSYSAPTNRDAFRGFRIAREP